MNRGLILPGFTPGISIRSAVAVLETVQSSASPILGIASLCASIRFASRRRQPGSNVAGPRSVGGVVSAGVGESVLFGCVGVGWVWVLIGVGCDVRKTVLRTSAGMEVNRVRVQPTCTRVETTVCNKRSVG